MVKRKVLFRNGTSGNAHGRLSSRGAATPPVVPNTILRLIGIVRVCRSEYVFYFRIIFRSLILIFDQKTNGRARSNTFEDAGQNLNRIGLPTLGRVFTGTGFATV